MHRFGKFHSTLIAEWTFLAIGLLLGAPATAARDDAAQLLKHADSIKSANHAEFTDLLKQLDAESAKLTPTQHTHLHYLKAWQTAYSGDYPAAIPQLDAVIAESKDITLRFRAGATIVNVLAIATHYENAYTRLSQMLELLPQVSDPIARQQGLDVAANLYNEAGQYDLALTYADKMIAENSVAASICKGQYAKLESLYKSGKLRTVGEEFQSGIDACVKVGEPIWINSIRTDAAKLYIAQGNYSDAIKLLKDNYVEVQNTHYPEAIARTDSTLAQAYWKVGDALQAQQYAQRVVDGGIKNEYTEALVGAYEVLYQVAQQQGDYQSAFAYHEKFAAADKGYLSDESARTLAYQMVHQQVQQKKLQIDTLSKQNQVLQLRQAVNKKTTETRNLLLLLLLLVLGFGALWFWRTKRSELKFITLARRDGLTGIYNRQYFLEAGEELLAYSAKSARDACVIVIDLDHFKLINDTHGHAMGDTVLKSAVAICQAHLRSVDVFGRIGGEEFAIAMPDCDLEKAMHLAEKLRQAIAGLFTAADGAAFPVHASFGVAATSCSGHQLKQMLADADKALYSAKREGRNRVVVFNSAVGISGGQADEAIERRHA